MVSHLCIPIHHCVSRHAVFAVPCIYLECTLGDLVLLSLKEMGWLKVATEMSLLVSMLFQTFLNPLKFLMDFNILVKR